jgi:hypothetical protein
MPAAYDKIISVISWKDWMHELLSMLFDVSVIVTITYDVTLLMRSKFA